MVNYNSNIFQNLTFSIFIKSRWSLEINIENDNLVGNRRVFVSKTKFIETRLSGFNDIMTTGFSSYALNQFMTRSVNLISQKILPNRHLENHHPQPRMQPQYCPAL